MILIERYRVVIIMFENICFCDSLNICVFVDIIKFKIDKMVCFWGELLKSKV